MTRLSALLFAIATGAGLAFTQPAAADSKWPERPLRMIVSFQAGSSSDTIARIVAEKLGNQIGQPVVVENRVGGSTVIGTDMLARSEPDGYTLGLANTTTHAASPAVNKKVTFDPIKDFTPLGMIGSSPFVLLGAKTLKASNVKELVAYAKANPGKLNYASAGPGTLSHLAGELFKKVAAVDVTHIPYKGTAQSVVDLLQGRIELLVGTINSTQEHVRQGKLTAFAVLSEEPVAALPGVPTAAEAGIPGSEAALWTAVVMPAGVEPEIVAKLSKAVGVVVNDPAVQAALKKQGIAPMPGGPELVTKTIKMEVMKWNDVVKTAKIGS